MIADQTCVRPQVTDKRGFQGAMVGSAVAIRTHGGTRGIRCATTMLPASKTKLLVAPGVGLEPTTIGLTGRRSAG